MLTCHCLYPCVRYVNMLVSSCSQVLLSWKPVNSYGDAFLIGYQLFHNGKPNETMFTPDVLQATISQLKPGNLCISMPEQYPLHDTSQPSFFLIESHTYSFTNIYNGIRIPHWIRKDNKPVRRSFVINVFWPQNLRLLQALDLHHSRYSFILWLDYWFRFRQLLHPCGGNQT